MGHHQPRARPTLDSPNDIAVTVEDFGVTASAAAMGHQADAWRHRADINLVNSRLEIPDRVSSSGEAAEHERVIAAATNQGIRSDSPNQDVVVIAPMQVVSAATAKQHIVSTFAPDAVIPVAGCNPIPYICPCNGVSDDARY